MSASKTRTNICSLLLLASTVGSATVSGCGSQVTDTGTETHWLTACDSDAECGGPTSCLCGVCTITCERDETCPNQAPVCVSADEGSCASASAPICLGPETTPSDSDGGAADFVAPPVDGGSAELVAPVSDLPARNIPEPNPCDDAGWCWQSSDAPGERFYALTKDGRYAVGESGVVFDTSGTYLPRPSGDVNLTTAVSYEDSLWVGSHVGVWRWSEAGWQQETDTPIVTLTVDAAGTLWGITQDALLRRDNGTWQIVELPKNPNYDSSRSLFDVTALDDGSVWVVGGYWLGRLPDGTLFTFENNAWREHPANHATGMSRFLQGPDTPYAYNTAAAEEGDVHVFAPLHDWKVLASATTDPLRTMFWGPDKRLWRSSELDLAAFGDEEASRETAVTCETAVAWDESTTLCAKIEGGLSYLSVDADGAIVTTSPRPTLNAFDPDSFANLPTSVWAQAPEAWAVSATDVWRAPLQHFDGQAWQSYAAEDDAFSAIRIDGTASDDVWFAGANEVRHWDGVEITVAPALAEGGEILALKVIESTDVWLLDKPLGSSGLIELRRFDGESWALTLNFPTDDGLAQKLTHDVSHPAGALAGSGNNLWAAFGSTVLHFDGTTWTTAWHFDASAPQVLLDLVTDDSDVWLLTRTNVLQYQDGAMVNRGYYAGELEYLALDDDYVWNLDGPSQRRLAR